MATKEQLAYIHRALSLAKDTLLDLHGEFIIQLPKTAVFLAKKRYQPIDVEEEFEYLIKALSIIDTLEEELENG